MRKYLREYKIQPKRGPKSKSKRVNEANFGKWLRDFSGGGLPSSIKELATLSGLSTHSIRNYLWRLRKRSHLLLKTQPWDSTEVVVWTDIKGHRIPDIAFDVVRSYVGQSGLIKVHVRLKSGHVHVFRVTADELEELYRPKKEGA